MMSNKSIRVAIFILTLVLGAGMGGPAWGASSGGVTKEELLELYQEVRETIMKEDIAAFEKMVIPPNPEAKRMTKEDLTEAKGFIEEIFPDPAKSKFLKFDRNDEEALMVFQTHLEDKENISLSAFRFKKKDGRWMLFAKLVGKSFSAQNPAADQEQIKKTLDHNASFRLEAEVKEGAGQAGSAETAGPGKTGSGALTVAQKTYSFAYAFAFRKKALGYEDRTNVHVVLTENQIPLHEIQNQLRENDDWSGFVNNLHLTFDPDMKPEGVSFWVKHESTSFSGSPFNVKSQAEVKGDRIKGAVKMEKPKKIFGENYIYDVAFDAPIISK